MTESEHTGYRESPDTSDGPVERDQSDDGDGEAGGVTLTTDDEAQREDSVMRPGNQSD